MGIILQNGWRNRAIFTAILIMLASLFLSRAILSVSIIVFLVITIFHRNIVSQLADFGKSPFLTSISLLFIIPFVSGIWSRNTQVWADIAIIKLPFLLLPLAFAGNWQLQERRWRIIGHCFGLFVLIGCCWSVWQYFQHMDVINKSYLSAKTLPVPLDNDHVRFSWLVSIAVVCSTLLIYTSEKQREKLWLTLLVVALLFYLHLLSARTGLLSIYLFFACFAVYLTRHRQKPLLIIIGGFLVVAVISWFLFPTLQNRIKYIVYDFSFLKNKNPPPGTSDANRLLSLQAGYDVLQKNPWGVGVGDIRDETGRWYATNVPQIAEQDKLFPSSEWIVHGDIAGWPGMLLFTAIIISPLFIKRIRHRFFWTMLVAIAIGSCVVETTLEIQFGIFIYCFSMLWWWKWLKIRG